MKVMIVVDLHGDLKRLKKIKKKAMKEKVKYLIDAGDISVFGRGLVEALHWYHGLGIPVFVVPGNHETEKELRNSAKLFDNVKYIHKKVVILGEYAIVGYGGGGFAMVDKEFERWGKKIASKLRGKKVILVLHGPPYDTKCDLIYGEHVGNKSYLKFIKKYKPELVVCGHLHETEGSKSNVGKTFVINPGDKGVVVEV